MDNAKLKSLFFEIIRFGIVGFVSFLFDWAVLMLVLHVFLRSQLTEINIAISTAAGFIIGVTVNYLLSVWFVFKASAQKGHGKSSKARVIFLVSAVIGLLLTQLIMNFGVIKLGFNETLVKIAATCIVMVWNYLSRKLLIFKNS
ncbi:MAG: GtrA family protein [Clostridiales bacterium]|jgi:putative flippase GtrA|nr:GtrA family protein [Clostridiales bacterium]